MAGIALVVLGTGCSRASPPSEADGNQEVRERIEAEADGRIKLLSFRKTDGQASDVHGVRRYELDWEGEIEFLEDCAWGPFLYSGREAPWQGRFKTLPMSAEVDSRSDSEKRSEWLRMRAVKKGEKVKCSGSLKYEESESGWRVAN